MCSVPEGKTDGLVDLVVFWVREREGRQCGGFWGTPSPIRRYIRINALARISSQSIES